VGSSHTVIYVRLFWRARVPIKGRFDAGRSQSGATVTRVTFESSSSLLYIFVFMLYYLLFMRYITVILNVYIYIYIYIYFMLHKLEPVLHTLRPRPTTICLFYLQRYPNLIRTSGAVNQNWAGKELELTWVIFVSEFLWYLFKEQNYATRIHRFPAYAQQLSPILQFLHFFISR
jgi:hypothetical protein